jgi:hypothetical protein
MESALTMGISGSEWELLRPPDSELVTGWSVRPRPRRWAGHAPCQVDTN